MKKTTVFKCFFVFFVAVVMISWAGAVFDDDDATNVPSCQAPVFWMDHLPSAFLPELMGQRPDAFFPLLDASSVNYLEMHEKSPPLSALVF